MYSKCFPSNDSVVKRNIICSWWHEMRPRASHQIGIVYTETTILIGYKCFKWSTLYFYLFIYTISRSMSTTLNNVNGFGLSIESNLSFFFRSWLVRCVIVFAIFVLIVVVLFAFNYVRSENGMVRLFVYDFCSVVRSFYFFIRFPFIWVIYIDIYIYTNKLWRWRRTPWMWLEQIDQKSIHSLFLRYFLSLFAFNLVFMVVLFFHLVSIDELNHNVTYQSNACC